VVQSGGERECTSNAGYYSEQVHEPAVRVQHYRPILGGKVSPNCYSSPCSLWEVPGSLAESDDEGEAAGAPEHENDLMVVSRKFGHVFSEKLRKPMNEFAGMAKALETGKIHVLAKEKGLMLDAIPNSAGAQTRMKRDHARAGIHCTSGCSGDAVDPTADPLRLLL
jgi:hypothetical protein